MNILNDNISGSTKNSATNVNAAGNVGSIPYEYPLDEYGSRTVSLFVSQEVYDCLIETQRDIWRTDKDAQRYTVSMDNATYEGASYGVCDTYPVLSESDDEDKELDVKERDAWNSLTDTQRRRTELYKENGYNLTTVAKIEGVSPQTVKESLDASLKKFKKALGISK